MNRQSIVLTFDFEKPHRIGERCDECNTRIQRFHRPALGVRFVDICPSCSKPARVDPPEVPLQGLPELHDYKNHETDSAAPPAPRED